MGDLLGLPLNASAQGPEIDRIIVLMHWLMAILFAGWGTYFVYVLFRFRSSRNRSADYVGVRGHTSSYIEGVIAIVEGIFLVGLAMPLWSMRVNDTPPESEATVIRIVAEQFAWNVHYPGRDGVFGRAALNLITAENPLGLDREDPAAKDDITTINQLNLPVGKPVIIHLSSKARGVWGNVRGPALIRSAQALFYQRLMDENNVRHARLNEIGGLFNPRPFP